MPYIASNEDARQQDSFKSALMGAAVVVGGIALGANAYRSSSLNRSSKDAIAKKLYGNHASQLGESAIDSIQIRNAKDIADSGMQPYMLKQRRNGQYKAVRTDGNFIQNMKTNITDKNLAAFNKSLNDYANGSDAVYSTSKMSLYNQLYDQSAELGIGLDSKNLVKVTNNIYDSKANQAIRKSEGVRMKLKDQSGNARDYDISDDAKISNGLWGKVANSNMNKSAFKGMHPDNPNTSKKYKDIWDSNYKATHGTNYDEDAAAQRVRSAKWSSDIKAQMELEALNEPKTLGRMGDTTIRAVRRKQTKSVLGAFNTSGKERAANFVKERYAPARERYAPTGFTSNLRPTEEILAQPVAGRRFNKRNRSNTPKAKQAKNNQG